MSGSGLRPVRSVRSVSMFDSPPRSVLCHVRSMTLLPLVTAAAFSSVNGTNTCSGYSANVTQAQCDAWGDFYDATGGPNWAVYGKPVCQNSKQDPCTCHGWDGGSPVCDPDTGTSIRMISFFGANLVGTVPASVSAFVNLTTFYVPGNKLSGVFPAGASAWSKLRQFGVHGNAFTGPLPALPFASMHQTQVSGCYLMDHYGGVGSNEFSCPWPQGVVGLCQKISPLTNLWVDVTDSDCK